MEAGAGSVLFEGVEHLSELLQVKLTAWIESSREHLDAPRLLSTTQRELEEEVQRGVFREDLRSRIDVLEVSVPPLRDHPADIPRLARELLAESASRLHVASPELPGEIERLLLQYRWPGNIRELRNAMERAVALSSGPCVERWALGPRFQMVP